MSRSGYSDDCEHFALYRANVDRSIRGARGQRLLREMVVALDAMDVKELAAHVFVDADDNRCCALGVVAVARGLDTARLSDRDDEPDIIGDAMDIAPCLAAEVAFENDERNESSYDHVAHGWSGETDAERWVRMRRWAASNLEAAPQVTT